MSDDIRDIIAKYGEPARTRWRGVFDRHCTADGLSAEGAAREADNALREEDKRGMFDVLFRSSDKATEAILFVERLVLLHDAEVDGDVDAVIAEARRIVGMK